MLGVGDARRGMMLERRRGGAAQGRDHAGEDHRQPVAAGVDDPRVAQHRQQVRPALDGLLTRVERALEQLGEQRVLLVGEAPVGQPRLRHVGELGGDPVGHLAHHGEDRALRRRAHGAVGAIGRARHRRPDQHRVDQLARARDQLLGGAADELGEDHAGVAAGAEQRRAGDRVDDLLAADLVERSLVLGEPVELVEHRAQGQRHVVAGVAVGDGEHVEVVDLLSPCLELAESALDDGAEAEKAGIGHGWSRAAYALVILPALRQRVQTYTRSGAPPSEMRTFWRLASNRRLVATMECERLCPKAGRLPQE